MSWEVSIKNVTFDQYGAVVLVSGKTGARRVRVIFAASYLAAWLDVHPQKRNLKVMFLSISRESNDKSRCNITLFSTPSGN